jgi:hypothetical protein
MTNLIGITGLARSGKDSFSATFVKHGFKRAAFANALKTTVAYIANEEAPLYFDDVTKEEYTEALGMTRRSALQKMGSAVRDTLGKDTWVNRTIRGWIAQGRQPTVITDCRYENEAMAIRNNGGIIVRIVRPGSGLQGEQGAHESEAGLPDELVDIEIVNDGTLGELAVEALKVVRLAGVEVGHDA